MGLVAAAGLAFFLRPGDDAGAEVVAAGVGEQRAVEIFRTLQANLYKAFDYETEDQVYDVLEQSVDGALLDDIYTEVYRSLLVVEKSAAVCKVREVDVLACEAKAIDPSTDGKAVRFDPADVIAALKAQASGAKGSAPSTSDSPATDADTVSRPIPD